jgi:cytochrome P450
LLRRVLTLQSGAEHRWTRRMVGAFAQPEVVAGYVPVMVELADRYLDRWSSRRELTWRGELLDFTFDTACTVMLGTPPGSQVHWSRPLQQYGEGFIAPPVRLPWTAYGRALRRRDAMTAYLVQQVEARRAAGTAGNDYLWRLLAARDDRGARLGSDAIALVLLDSLFAAQLNGTSALCSLLLMLTQHPSVLARARAEQDAIGRTAPITMAHIAQMPYLDRVVTETLRLVSPVIGVFRKATRAFAYGGYTVPAGWTVLCRFDSAHLDPGAYPCPHAFDPDRFGSPRDGAERVTGSFVPFGSPKRECVGKAYSLALMKVLAAAVIRGYDWEPVPGQDLSIKQFPSPRPVDGLEIRAFRRRDPVDCHE